MMTHLACGIRGLRKRLLAPIEARNDRPGITGTWFTCCAVKWLVAAGAFSYAPFWMPNPSHVYTFSSSSPLSIIQRVSTDTAP